MRVLVAAGSTKARTESKGGGKRPIELIRVIILVKLTRIHTLMHECVSPCVVYD